ncbi:MAG TPA: lipase family protein [Ferruginibacter sp.]|nr:lipase family protein [Ferruginibacter sp.]HPH91155.1 lipase family protein [Ferruginibacter sp.]
MSKRIFVLLHFFAVTATSQQLQPGFNKEEYKELMYVSARTTVNENYYKQLPAPAHFKMIYQSNPMGLDNLWDLWKDENNHAVISIRGTTQNGLSWLENFYSAMVPANGELKVADDYTFKYQLATNPRATVHVGWLLGLAFLSRDMLPKIDSLYKTGVKDFYVIGHSQGGALAYLLTAHLYHLQKQNLLPQDVKWKTYCSAAPKPGNLYFAYDYEALTQNGWAYNVVNSADWVPETPFSIQTLSDFNTTNPFVNAKSVIKKMGFPKNVVMKIVYNKMDRKTRKAMKYYCKNLGTRIGKMLTKNLPGFEPPPYAENMNYVRTGNYITLLADEAYYQLFPDSKENAFAHHLHKPYLYLLNQLK